MNESKRIEQLEADVVRLQDAVLKLVSLLIDKGFIFEFEHREFYRVLHPEQPKGETP